MSYSDPAFLDAQNNPDARVRFQDGTVVQLFYGYGGQRRIEDKYGNLQAFFNKLSPEGENQMPSFSAIIDAIVFGGWTSGLTIERVEDPTKGLDSKEVEKHMKAVEAALVASFPTQTAAQSQGSSENPQGTHEKTQLSSVPQTKSEVASAPARPTETSVNGERPTTLPPSYSTGQNNSFG